MNNVKKQVKNGPVFVLQTYEDRLANSSKELPQKLTERLSNLKFDEKHNENKQNGDHLKILPPPPPPPPLENGHNSTPSKPSSFTQPSPPISKSDTLKSTKSKKAPPVPVKYSVLSYQQPPPCPTPDYDTLSVYSNASSKARNSSQTTNNMLRRNGESVEMDSLDSYKLNSPTSEVSPKPPNNYFNKQPLTAQLSNQSSTSFDSGTLRKPRPVSVTIGEYPTMRRHTPGRLDFLSQNGDGTLRRKGDVPITSQLASELTQTLSRSNLRKRTESMENLLSSPVECSQATSSCVRTSLSKLLTKSTSDLTENRLPQHNKVTINVNNNKNETLGGILKNNQFVVNNGNGMTINNGFSVDHFDSHADVKKGLMQQKSITFGEVPTVIKDRSVSVT